MMDLIEARLVTTIPADPKSGVLYVSVEYGTTLHLCACGCGREVVLGISPNDWELCWDGETVTLDPSVGNWSFPCQSHYLIRRSRIVTAGRWNDAQIARGRALDVARKRPLAAPAVSELSSARTPAATPDGTVEPQRRWQWLRRNHGRFSRR